MGLIIEIDENLLKWHCSQQISVMGMIKYKFYKELNTFKIIGGKVINANECLLLCFMDNFCTYSLHCLENHIYQSYFQFHTVHDGSICNNDL